MRPILLRPYSGHSVQFDRIRETYEAQSARLCPGSNQLGRHGRAGQLRTRCPSQHFRTLQCTDQPGRRGRDTRAGREIRAGHHNRVRGDDRTSD